MKEPLERTPDSLKGSSAELLVACDLMKRGYWAFRNVAEHGPIDLLAVGVDKSLLKVEVTTARASNTARKAKAFNKHILTRGYWDVMAIVTHDGIYYMNRDFEDIEPCGKPKLANVSVQVVIEDINSKAPQVNLSIPLE